MLNHDNTGPNRKKNHKIFNQTAWLVEFLIYVEFVCDMYAHSPIWHDHTHTMSACVRINISLPQSRQ